MSTPQTIVSPAQTMIALPDAAIRLREPYRVAYDAALRGDLGQVERRGGRIYVAADAVEQRVTDAKRRESR